MNATEFISESNLTTAEILIIKLFTYARPFSCQQPQLLWRILNVNSSVLDKICMALGCKIGDIVSFVPADKTDDA